MSDHCIDSDTPLVPEVIADMVTRDRAEADRLCARAREEWSTSEEFRASFAVRDMRDVLREWFELWLTQNYTTLTVIFSEPSSPVPPAYPSPLIYDLEFDHHFEKGDGVRGVSEYYAEEILQRVAETRAAELESYDVVGVREGLKIHLAIVGSVEIVMDWRP